MDEKGVAAPSLPGGGRAPELFENRAIALHTGGSDIAPLGGSLDRAAWLGPVRAIGEPAFPEERPHFGKAGGQLPRVQSPDPDFAEPRCVDRLY